MTATEITPALRTFQIAVLPGDGIGVDVTREAVRVLRAVESRLTGVRFVLQEHSVGAGEYLRSGNPLPAAALDGCAKADAVLLGAMGLPSVRWPDGREMTPQIDLREKLDLYAGPRPIKLYHANDTPLKGYGSGGFPAAELETRLARDGARFTDTYAACPVCSPTRARRMISNSPGLRGRGITCSKPRPCSGHRQRGPL
jgi:hypothetical protein